MKKALVLLLAVVVVFAFAACGEQPAADRNDLCLYVDGMDVTDGNVSYSAIKDCFTQQTVAGQEFMATTLADLCAYDITTVVGAFFETTDGYVKYYGDLSKVFVLADEQVEDAFQAIKGEDGADTYAVIVDEADAKYIAGVKNIYMVTVPAEFSVAIKVNGEEKGTLTMSDFMKKTGDTKIPTAMYDGSFLYNQGESTYEGRFLGIDLATMITKLQSGLGIADIPAVEDCANINFTGFAGMGSGDAPAINTEYSTDPADEKYFGNVQFFCMYDGMTENDQIKQCPLGLSVFLNGTGSRWVTYDLAEIDFITK